MYISEIKKLLGLVERDYHSGYGPPPLLGTQD